MTRKRWLGSQEDKRAKYQDLGPVLPFVLGTLGAWKLEKEDIRAALDIPGRAWHALRRRCRILAIRGTIAMVVAHLDCTPTDE